MPMSSSSSFKGRNCQHPHHLTTAEQRPPPHPLLSAEQQSGSSSLTQPAGDTAPPKRKRAAGRPKPSEIKLQTSIDALFAAWGKEQPPPEGIIVDIKASDLALCWDPHEDNVLLWTLPYKQRIVKLLAERQVTNDVYREWPKSLLEIQLAYEAKSLQIGALEGDGLRAKYKKLISQDVGSLLSSMATVKSVVNKGGWGKNLKKEGRLDAFLEAIDILAFGHFEQDQDEDGVDQLLTRLDFEALHDSFIEPFAAIVEADADFFPAVETDDDAVADVVLPTFLFHALYTKVTSTGHGDSLMENRQNFLDKVVELRAGINALKKKAAKLLGQEYKVGQQQAFLQSVVVGDVYPMKLSSWHYFNAKELMEIMLAIGKTTCEILDIKVEKLLGPVKFKLVENRRKAQSKKTMELKPQ